MTDKDKEAETLTDAALDEVQGGGLLDAEPGTFGFEAVTLERGIRRAGGRLPGHTPEWTDHNDADPGYIGETEKNVWKAPAGVTRDTEFET